jgi:uncharacterized protein
MMEILSPYFERNIRCHLCEQPFTTTKIRSRFVKLKGLDTDFCPLYISKELNPLIYNVHVCPHCGYSFTDDFYPKFIPAIKDKLALTLFERWTPKNYGAHRTIEESINTYKLAIFCGIEKKEKHIVIAGLYLRTAWLYRIMNNHEEEQRFLKLAVQEYVNAYLIEDVPRYGMSEVKLLYLIGELSRRTGQYIQAASYFSRVFQLRKHTIEKRIVEMARDQWYLTREAYKKSATN